MGNIGDDLMLDSILSTFVTDPSIESITVFCNTNYFQSSPKTRFISSTTPGKIAKLIALYQADLVCWGGGTCVGEQNDNSGIYRLLQIVKICERLKVPFAFLGIGIGTVTSNAIKNIALDILNRASFISFRDDESLTVARNVLGFRRACVNCGDLASLGWKKRNLLPRQNVWQGEISFSGVLGQAPEVAEHWGKQLANLVTDIGVRVNFLPAHTKKTDDNEFHQQIAAYLIPDSYKIHSLATPFEFIPLLAGMDFHIGMRLHSVIIADILGIPNIAVEYSPKVAFYLRKSGSPINNRLVQPLGVIESESVQSVYKNYKQPIEFLDAEEESAQECLGALLATFS